MSITNLYVYQLPLATQQAIKLELTLVLSTLQLSESELSESLDNALNSRLCDLSDTININQFI